MEVLMANQFRSAATRSVLALAVAAIALAGCATQRQTAPAGAEQKIENASSRVDHEGLASRYEAQAATDAAAARRHQGYAATYRKNTLPASGPQEHLVLAKHCENLARAYQQAADENTALAKLHRELAAAAK
jgi:hypothetical protein